MCEVVLIHGYGVDLSSWRRPADPVHAGFQAFAELVEQTHTKVFRWSIPRHLPVFESLKLSSYVDTYRQERRKAHERETWLALQALLETEAPRLIIGHSLGTQLIHNYLTEQALPDSVKRVVWAQADLSHKPRPETFRDYQRIKAQDLEAISKP